MGRKHNTGLPRGWQWRGGRPRWNPSPNIYKLGWRGIDLKDNTGAYLDSPQSQIMAKAINEAIEAWKKGQPVPARFAHKAPGADAAAPPPADARSIGALIDKWIGNEAAGIEPHFTFLQREPSTQKGYRSTLKRFVDALAGYGEAPPKKSETEAYATYRERVAEQRAASIFVLEPRETSKGILQPVRDAYVRLKDNAGVNMARSCIVTAGTWLDFLNNEETKSISRAWASSVKRQQPRGRIRTAGVPEVEALKELADAMGKHSVADAISLGVILSWSAVDRRTMTWDQIREDRVHTKRSEDENHHEGRQKTGRVGATTLGVLGKARIAMIRERQARLFGPNVTPTHVIINEATGAPYTEAQYGVAYREVRAAALAKYPDLKLQGLQERDLRDTAITHCLEAGLSYEELATRSMQARASIPGLLDKAYGEYRPKVADAAAAQLDELHAALGMRA